MKMSRKLLALAVLAAVFAGSVFFLQAAYKNDHQETADAVYKETGELLDDITKETNRFADERLGELELMAKYIETFADDREKLQHFLKEQDDKMPFLAGLGFIYPDGEIMAANGSWYDIQEEDAFERAMSGQMTMTDLFTLREKPDVRVTAISVPVWQNGNVIGVLSGAISLSDIIHELISETSLDGTVFLLKDDEIIYTSDDSLAKDELLSKQNLITRGEESAPNGIITENRKRARYIMYKRAWNDWTAAVDSSGNPAMDSLEAKRSNMILVGLAIFLLLACLYGYYERLVRRQLRETRIDELTGLGNAMQIDEDGLALQRSRKQDYTTILLNLREFRKVNNWAGYETGNDVLAEVGKRLKAHMTGKDNVYRIGGGEFAVVLIGSRSRQEAEAAAGELIGLLKQPIVLDGMEPIRLDAYAGIRHYRKEEGAAVHFVSEAVFACQEARQQTDYPYAYFTEALAELNNDRKLFSKELAEALALDEFRLVYQPIYSVQEDRIVSFETLLRWQSAKFGMVRPDQFIPLLEESGMILQAGDWIIEQAALQVKGWRAQGFPELYVTVNVSVKQLLDDTFLCRVKNILSETGASPESLVFEITESVVVEDSEKALATVTALNELGISTALDDFGTGYSSLSILRLLPFQYLKVDKSFLDDMTSRESQAASVVKGIISIAAGLRQVTVIEGVETAEQLGILKELGADRIQGYYFSRPVPPEDAFDLLRVLKKLPATV
ncbi:hypothetical protein NCCP2716_21140 [Sporosarcina sp. NCCP-2716]|uniref:bifunctional diguanylate cyclase/phosphodiesterase n=1 Tax=Sporosarcina sp. NCCP-2716 TaxID=2943679 RepID=UPI00203BFB27|nr:EAL domain-containing protein [Sporosarcina sp. NCCP-2716]GKV69616.1 hypothetical protein NCCP2716_21140 [Sporosarcina sp. NCCP-2716]